MELGTDLLVSPAVEVPVLDGDVVTATLTLAGPSGATAAGVVDDWRAEAHRRFAGAAEGNAVVVRRLLATAGLSVSERTIQRTVAGLRRAQRVAAQVTRSGPEERTIPLVPELRALARRGFNRIRYVAEIRDRRGPFHLCLPAHVLAPEANRGVLEIDTVIDAGPPNLERHRSRLRRRPSAKECIDDAVEIQDVNVRGLIHGAAGAWIDSAHVIRRQARRPEQSARSNPWIEVDNLRSRTGIGVDVDSYEPESALPRFAVHAAINALHEAHIGCDERIPLLLAVRNARLRHHSVDVRQADHTVEVGDGRRLRVDRIEKPGRTGAVDVESAAERRRTAGNGQRIIGRGGFDASRSQDVAAQREAGGNRCAGRTHECPARPMLRRG